MFVVRKLNRELAFVFRFRSLISVVRFAKSEARIFARRGAHMTDCANRGAGADESLSRKELLPVATHTRIVIGKVCGIGKISLRRPGGRQLVTGVAHETLVFLGRMEKRRIPGGRSAWRLRFGGSRY